MGVNKPKTPISEKEGEGQKAEGLNLIVGSHGRSERQGSKTVLGVGFKKLPSEKKEKGFDY